MLKEMISKIKNLFTKAKNEQKLEKREAKLTYEAFSFPWFLMYIPCIVSNKKEFDSMVNLSRFIKMHRSEIPEAIVKLDNVQIGLILDLINKAIEGFLEYEQHVGNSIKNMLKDNERYFEDDTKRAFIKYSTEHYNLITETLQIYRDLSVLIFMNRKEENKDE